MYCNPIILLGLENLPLEALDPERLKTARRELLGAYQSSGARALFYAGAHVPYKTAWDAIERLDAPEWRRCYHQLLQERDVEALLQGQWALNFPNVLKSPIWKDAAVQEQLRQVAEPVIARQLLTAVQQHYRKRVQELVALIGQQAVLQPQRCYAPVIDFLEAQGRILHFTSPEPQLPDYTMRVNALSKDLKGGYLYEARTLNLLPTALFQNVFNEFSLALCVAAGRVFTGKPDFARKLFSVARLLNTDKTIQQQADFHAAHVLGKWEPPIDESEPEPPMPQSRRPQPNTAGAGNTPPPKQKQTGWSPPKNPPPLKNKPPRYTPPPPPAYQPRVTPINTITGERLGKWLFLLLLLGVLGIMIFETGFCKSATPVKNVYFNESQPLKDCLPPVTAAQGSYFAQLNFKNESQSHKALVLVLKDTIIENHVMLIPGETKILAIWGSPNKQRTLITFYSNDWSDTSINPCNNLGFFKTISDSHYAFFSPANMPVPPVFTLNEKPKKPWEARKSNMDSRLFLQFLVNKSSSDSERK